MHVKFYAAGVGLVGVEAIFYGLAALFFEGQTYILPILIFSYFQIC